MTDKPYNKVNRYTCVICDKQIVTEDLDEGTTPAQLTCPVCNGDMVSCQYNCSQKLEASYFWFRPESPLQLKRQVKWELRWMDAKGLMKLDMALTIQQQHVDKGGLLLGPSRQVIDRWKLQTPNKVKGPRRP